MNWPPGRDGEEITFGVVRIDDADVYGIIAGHAATIPVIGLLIFVLGFVVGLVL